MPKKSVSPKARVSNSKNKSIHRVRKRISLRDRLGQLTIRAACRLLGASGDQRLRQASRFEIDLDEDVRLVGDTLTCRVPDRSVAGGRAIVSIVEMLNKPNGMHFHCNSCGVICEHVAATLSTVLENKLTLGLSAIPDPHEPMENLSESELIARAIAERQERAIKEKMVIKSADSKQLWIDYAVTSLESGKSYRVALRSLEHGESYCSCPDFRVNHLGTCKHILHVIEKVSKKFPKIAFQKPYSRKNISLRVDYGATLGLRFNLPDKLSTEAEGLLKSVIGKTIENADRAVALIKQLERSGIDVRIYPDAEEYIEKQLIQKKLHSKSHEIRESPATHPLRTTLLKAELLPYQMDGIAFAIGAGRAILADDMGLGKTIQGIGVAELFAKYASIKNVLVVCPASLKSQWKSEIDRFCNRTCQIVLGSADERAAQYEGEGFFKICNYEQVVRDEAIVQRIAWDLIILDEGQRIKNWESKTSRVFKTLKSTFALVLSGTPLENRLEELYTVVGFVDSQRLGPAYRFFHRHRMVDETSGKIKGYKNLDQLRENLKPILLRRTRASVLQQLPERTTEVVRIRPTEEQATLSNEHVARAARIAAKAFLTEMDLLRLQKHLLMARMAANSTYLVDKQEPSFSSKLDTLDELFAQIADEPTRKVVLFSEWTTMLDLIEPLLAKHGIQFVRMDGSVPQKKRPQIVHEFQNDPKCRMILLTNAGSTGLNLQAANTVINVELPWNPAVLEQRISRAHRMGQKNPVHVYLLITEDTIEERLLGTLAAKRDLAIAALDVESEVSEVTLESGMEELKKRLERLLGEKPAAAVDESQHQEVLTANADLASRREQVASASGELLGAALNLVAQLLDNGQSAPPETVIEIKKNLANCVDRDEAGRPQLRLTLPNDGALQSLAETLAKLLVKAAN